MPDVVIKCGHIITPTGKKEGYVIIDRGKIIDVITAPAPEMKVDEDATGYVLMPGIVDPHVHINEPGRTDWEGFDTATRAALAGGITSLVDMPLNASPVTTTVSAFEQKLAATKGKLHVNCGFWGGVIPGNQMDLEPLIDKGVLGFKAFLTHSGIDEFPNVNEADLRTAMPIIARHGLPLLVHCELESAVVPPSATEGEAARSYHNYLLSRPRKWEDDAVAMMIRLCEEFHCGVHIVHLSSSDSLPQIQKAREKGLPLTVETGQHYLFFDEAIPDGATQYKCAPPIREKENREKLWKALKEGLIDFVATDHSPATPGLKHLDDGNFMKAWGGIASLQFALPVLWKTALEHGCSEADMTKWLCDQPARFAGLSQKGRIEAGCDADILIWDPAKAFTITEDIILHRHKLTPYLGRELKGVTHQVYLSGKKIFDRGAMQLNQGSLLLHRS